MRHGIDPGRRSHGGRQASWSSSGSIATMSVTIRCGLSTAVLLPLARSVTSARMPASDPVPAVVAIPAPGAFVDPATWSGPTRSASSLRPAQHGDQLCQIHHRYAVEPDSTRSGRATSCRRAQAPASRSSISASSGRRPSNCGDRMLSRQGQRLPTPGCRPLRQHQDALKTLRPVPGAFGCAADAVFHLAGLMQAAGGWERSVMRLDRCHC